jgi:hypothetical protein
VRRRGVLLGAAEATRYEVTTVKLVGVQTKYILAELYGGSYAEWLLRAVVVEIRF